jgi:hypothetical protein
MNKYVTGGLAALMIGGAAHAAGSSPAEVVQRHVSSGGNLDAMIGDYADDAVVMQQGRVLQGKAAIRAFYANMFGPRPAAGAGAPPPGAPAGGPPKMTVDKVWEEGNVGFVSWHMGPVKATEEFLVRDGKIEVQSVFMQGGPPGPPPGQ